MSISSIGSTSIMSTFGVTDTNAVSKKGNANDFRAALENATKAQKDQFKGDISTLFTAVQSGDVTAAQAALQAVNQDRSAIYSASSSDASKAASPQQTDWQALVSAIGNGDAQGMKDALTKLQADHKAGKGGHHHHHHHGGGSAQPAATGTDTSSAGASSNAAATIDAATAPQPTPSPFTSSDSAII